MKKTICLLMAIAMLVCSIPFGAFAVGEGYSSWEVHMWNGVESLSSTRAFELEEWSMRAPSTAPPLPTTPMLPTPGSV